MSNARIRMFGIVSCFCFWLVLSCGGRAAAQTNAAPDGSAKAAEAASNETFRAYLQLEQQIHEAQAAIERTRREAESAAARTTEVLAGRLQSLEQAMASQRDAMQSTGKFMLTVLSIFAGAGFIGIVLTAYFQWRTVNRLAEVATSTPAIRPAGLLADAEEHPAMSAGLVEQTSERLSGAVERLERRILELEHSARPPLKDHGAEKNGSETSHPALPDELEADGSADSASRIKQLLDRGQALLNSDQADAAVEFIDQALSLDPNHTEALVKKGTVLERMRKFTEAIECYDRAIAVDGSMTIAYLYKGGLYNRMERFSEAVECYEQALRTQEKRG